MTDVINNMNIIQKKLKFKSLDLRSDTKYIILHHRAGNGDVESIHRQHIIQGYSGIGYHFYVRKNGEIYSGRPLKMQGAHCLGQNKFSVGVCFEGNFENEKMSAEQFEAGKAIIAYLKSLYPKAEIKRHSDLCPTACPGRFFPFDEMKKEVTGYMSKKIETANDIIWELKNGKLKIEINDVGGAVNALEKAKKDDSPLYWLLMKIANK